MVKKFRPVQITQIPFAMPHHSTNTYLCATAILNWHPAGNDKEKQMFIVIPPDWYYVQNRRFVNLFIVPTHFLC